MKHAALKQFEMTDTDTDVPPEMFEPMEFQGADGARFTCGVAALWVLGSVMVVISESLYDAPASLVKNNFAAIATQCYHERFRDVEPWRIRWRAHHAASDIHPARFHEIRLDWVPDEIPGGSFGYARWRTLSYREGRSLLEDMQKEILVREALRRAQSAPTPLRQAGSRFAAPPAVPDRSLADMLAGWLLKKLRLAVAWKGQSDSPAEPVESRPRDPVAEQGAMPDPGDQTPASADQPTARNAAAKVAREKMMTVAVAQHDYDEAIHIYFAAPTERNFARLRKAYDAYLSVCGREDVAPHPAPSAAHPTWPGPSVT